MRNLLAFLGALIIALVVVGYFQNWFQIRTTPGQDGNRNISIDIDSKKVGEDLNKTEKNIQTFIEKKSEDVKTSAPALKDKDAPKSPTGN